jgi:hypothetical protein
MLTFDLLAESSLGLNASNLCCPHVSQPAHVVAHRSIQARLRLLGAGQHHRLSPTTRGQPGDGARAAVATLYHQQHDWLQHVASAGCDGPVGQLADHGDGDMDLEYFVLQLSLLWQHW